MTARILKFPSFAVLFYRNLLCPSDSLHGEEGVEIDFVCRQMELGQPGCELKVSLLTVTQRTFWKLLLIAYLEIFPSATRVTSPPPASSSSTSISHFGKCRKSLSALNSARCIWLWIWHLSSHSGVTFSSRQTVTLDPCAKTSWRCISSWSFEAAAMFRNG